jgi:hypothetical protein
MMILAHPLKYALAALAVDDCATPRCATSQFETADSGGLAREV